MKDGSMMQAKSLTGKGFGKIYPPIMLLDSQAITVLVTMAKKIGNKFAM